MSCLQYNTKNKSFLKMYKILKDFGIKNCDFFLELKDESLLNVDYFDEDHLTKEQKLRIHAEIARNPWFYYREIVRIPTAGEKRMFELNRATLAICWAIENDISIMVVLPRQCYKTYTICTAYSKLFYWDCKNTEFMLFSYSDSILQGNMQRIKEIRDTLPSYLNLYNPNTDKDNSREMRFDTGEYYNHLRIKAPSKSPDEASKVGRGFSSPCMWYDELFFIPQVGEIYDASSFSYKTVAEIAKNNGSHHHRIMSSSVGRLDDKSGLWGFNFLNSCCDFNEKMYDYDKDTINEMINKNSTNNFLRIEFMYYDLGKPDTYLEEMRKDSTSEEAFQREVLNKWQKTGATHPLGKSLVDMISNEIHEPADVLVIDNVYFLKLYKKIDEIDFNKPYVAGVDTGGNLLHDFSTFVVVDPTTFEVIGVLRSNQFSTNRFKNCLINLLTNVFTNTTVIIERNYIGITLCDALIEYSYSLGNRIYCSEDGKPGFATTTKTRPLLYNNLLRIAVINQYKLIHDSHIINEIISLTVGRNGRIDHPEGGHDDTLMAYLFTRWFFTYANNANKYLDISLIGASSNSSGDKSVDQERLSNNSNYMKNIKNVINGDSYLNTDGTIDFHSIAKMQNNLINKNFINEDNKVEDTMSNISFQLFDKTNTKFERNIEKLENKEEMLEDEDILFDETPATVSERVSRKEENIKSKLNFDYSNGKKDFKKILFT